MTSSSSTHRSLRANSSSRRTTPPDSAEPIGAASKASGVSAKMIRHYERIGLIQPAARSASNYRSYSAQDVQTLRFVGRARSVGFSLDEIAQLLALWRKPNRSSAEVKALAQRHVADLKGRMAALLSMITVLEALADQCPGDHQPDCPILDDLADPREPDRRGRA